jgi:hypothetical protein
VTGRRRGSWAAGPVAVYAVLACAADPLVAQEAIPGWSVTTGSGFVFRSVHNGSFGVHIRAARVIPVISGLYLEPGITWHGYLSSDAWFGRPDFMFCPDPSASCEPEPRRDGIGFAGPELGITYLKPGAANSLHPVAGIGVYRSTASSSPATKVGASLGVAWPFHGSLRGPALEARYFRMFNDPRFISLISFSLGWYF